MIESNGFGCNGVNPEANLEFLTEPSDAHLMWLPGNASERLLRCGEDDHAVEMCRDGHEERESLSVARFDMELRIRLSLMVGVR